MSDTLQRLQDWYKRHCDGDWEHQYGVRIDTLDNPGWSVEIDLHGTRPRGFEPLKVERSEEDWIQCRREGSKWLGFGGARNLDELLRTFLGWAADR